MAKEIERKFLVKNDSYKAGAQGLLYRQGYIYSSLEKTVRLRLAGARAFLTIKGATLGFSRDEYEYEISLADCVDMLDSLAEKPLIEKVRYRIPQGGLVWEVDEFLGENVGLVVAEIELESESQSFERPDWLDREVTGDPRYYNASLMKRSFSKW